MGCSPTVGSTDGRKRPVICFGEVINFAFDTFNSNKVKFLLTALGMMIGTASLILVVTIGLTGKQYILNQIQAIGANMIYAYYEGGSQTTATSSLNDYLTADDARIVKERVPGIQASSVMLQLNDRIAAGGGKERD